MIGSDEGFEPSDVYSRVSMSNESCQPVQRIPKDGSAAEIYQESASLRIFEMGLTKLIAIVCKVTYKWTYITEYGQSQ